MRLKPHQYVLILIILALGAWNLHRMSHPRAVPVPGPARGTSPAWAAYDGAAAQRDADDAHWQPALAALNTAYDAATTEREDLNACRTWLLFYRDEHLHPQSSQKLGPLTVEHVDSCVADHRDVAK